MREAMRQVDIRAALITPGADLRYVAGYDAKPLERLTCLVVPSAGDPVLIAPELEASEAQHSAFGAAGGRVITWAETEDPFTIIRTLVDQLQAGPLAVDDHMWAQRVLRIQEMLPDRTLLPAGPLLGPLRQIKSEEEIEHLAQAAAAIDRVHARVPEILRAGMTEREAGVIIAEAILDEGHVTVDFVIVASGPNGANPHHEVSDRVMQAGDPIVVDIGGSMPSGFRSDCTRTYVLGDASPEYRQAYESLLAAQRRASEYVEPGRTFESIDATARRVMSEHIIGGTPLSDFFIHRIGHGIGLESHEEPYLVAGNIARVCQGMTFSIEPGFYIPGQYGARIEDIVVCTEDGHRSLNHQPRELIRINA